MSRLLAALVAVLALVSAEDAASKAVATPATSAKPSLPAVATPAFPWVSHTHLLPYMCAPVRLLSSSHLLRPRWPCPAVQPPCGPLPDADPRGAHVAQTRGTNLLQPAAAASAAAPADASAAAAPAKPFYDPFFFGMYYPYYWMYYWPYMVRVPTPSLPRIMNHVLPSMFCPSS